MIRIGIDLGGTKIEGIVLAAGRELARHRVSTPAGDYEATLRAVVDLVNKLEHAVGIERGYASVGVGIPGTLSPATRLVKNANSTCLIGKPLDLDLETALKRPVRLANDANCFAVSEATDGAGRGLRVVLGVILGTGVGGGIAIDGRALIGANAIAGEWGHNPLPWPTDDERPGPVCYCGKRGCIETFLSGPGLVADYGETNLRPVDASAIAARANDGDPGAKAVLHRHAERLARALATIINVLDPDVIVLGGGLSNLAHLYDVVPNFWQRHAFSDRVETPLRRAMHGDSSGVRGAAWLWNDRPD